MVVEVAFRVWQVKLYQRSVVSYFRHTQDPLIEAKHCRYQERGRVEVDRNFGLACGIRSEGLRRAAHRLRPRMLQRVLGDFMCVTSAPATFIKIAPMFLVHMSTHDFMLICDVLSVTLFSYELVALHQSI